MLHQGTGSLLFIIWVFIINGTMDFAEWSFKIFFKRLGMLGMEHMPSLCKAPLSKIKTTMKMICYFLFSLLTWKTTFVDFQSWSQLPISGWCSLGHWAYFLDVLTDLTCQYLVEDFESMFIKAHKLVVFHLSFGITVIMVLQKHLRSIPSFPTLRD